MTNHLLNERHHRWEEWIEQDEGVWGPAAAALVFALWMLAMLAIAYNAHKYYSGTQLAFEAPVAAAIDFSE